jgi:hypothetical protein
VPVDIFDKLGAGALSPGVVIALVGIAIAGLTFLVGRWLVVHPKGVSTSRPEVDSRLLKVVAAADRRAAVRRSGNVVEVSLWDGSNTPQIRGLIQDRSTGGLRLLVDEPIEPGAVLKVRPRLAPITTPWTTVIIRDCQFDGGMWELRVQFQQTPPYNVLLLFG